MSDIIDISTTILGAGELERKIKEVADIQVPHQELGDRFRWLQCIVKNETQFHVLLSDSCFDSGRYWDVPGDFPPFDQLVFSCCSLYQWIPLGVDAGTSFRLVLDDKHYHDFALGFINPVIGSYKAGVAESSNPNDGFEAANEGGGYIESKYVFEGKDKDGKPAKFRIHISAVPGQKPLYVVKQVLVD